MEIRKFWNKIMEMRARNVTLDDDRGNEVSAGIGGKGSYQNNKDARGRGNWLWRECREMGRVAMAMLKGRGSTLGYLFIPAMISLLWLLLMLITTRSPSLPLEERLSQKYLKVRFSLFSPYFLLQLAPKAIQIVKWKSSTGKKKKCGLHNVRRTKKSF